MPPKPWKTLSSREVYKNPWTRVREVIAEMPNGKQTIYGVIECNDAVGVLPFIDDDHVTGPNWDHNDMVIGVSTVVPEPGTLILLGLGLTGAGLCYRRKRS